MRFPIAAAIVAMAIPGAAVSQNTSVDASALQIGARARILESPRDRRYTLIIVGSESRDSLRFNVFGSSDTKSLAWQQLSKMDASIGSHRNVARGLGLGFLVGALGGAILGAVSSGGAQDFGPGGLAALLGAMGGVLGAAGGAAIGYEWRTETWVPVNLPRGPLASDSGLINDNR